MNLSCDRKFRNFWGSSKAIRRLNDLICLENGYSIVEHPKGRSQKYNKWLGEKKQPTCYNQNSISTPTSLFKWLNRRSQKKSFTWEAFRSLLKDYPLVSPRIYVSIYGD